VSARDIDTWFATCPKGVESLLASELTLLGANSVSETVAGVHFEGPQSVAYRACLWSRLANRILLFLAEIPASDAQTLYQGLRNIAWPSLFASKHSIAVFFNGTNDHIRNSQFGAQRTKDAIVDAFVAASGERPDVNRQNPAVAINVRLVRDMATVSIDFSGGSLHQRGYRLQAGAAPLKENLAAAILLRADWPGMAARGGALIDPMCGSGTLLIEGAMMAADIAPGLQRKRFGFEHLARHRSDQWQALCSEANGRAERGKAAQLPEIRGYDMSAKVIDIAMGNIARAGLEKVVRVSVRRLEELSKPTHMPLPHGLLLTNPPYGERLGDKHELAPLYRQLGEQMVGEFSGWQAGIFTSELSLGKATGLRSHKRYSLWNGALATQLLLFNLENNTLRDTSSEDHSKSEDRDALSPGAQMFANRLRKNRKRLSSWVKRENVQCYRLYDADMPEYAVAVDVYGENIHVAEYKAPSGISPDDALRRMDEVRSALPVALEVDPESVVYKERSRQRGKQQYEKHDTASEMLCVNEGQAQLLVNLTDYLDTGLFLDHRPLRLRIAQESLGKDFLNLFCYTGSATIHAALGGASTTTSVDNSNTYIRWLRKNLRLNQLDLPQHAMVKADCGTWLGEASTRYDLILLDPPSFSNSKSVDESFDVQRDHAELVRQCMRLLKEGGRLYFSNNRRGFKLDDALGSEFNCRDITKSTLGPDFQRNAKIHTCWMLEHS